MIGPVAVHTGPLYSTQVNLKFRSCDVKKFGWVFSVILNSVICHRIIGVWHIGSRVCRLEYHICQIHVKNAEIYHWVREADSGLKVAHSSFSRVSKSKFLYNPKRQKCPTSNIRYVDSLIRFGGLKYPHSCSPSVSLRINRNLVRKGIGFAGSNRWDVVFFSVDSRHDFHCCLQKHSLHSLPDFCSFYRKYPC